MIDVNSWRADDAWRHQAGAYLSQNKIDEYVRLVIADSAFAAARSAFLDELLSLYQGNGFLTRLLIEAGRSVVFFTMLTLHAKFDKDDRKTWPTVSHLKRIVSEFGVTSERRVHDIVKRIIATDYAQADRVPADKRVRVLSPSPKMLRHHRDWLRAFYSPLQLMFPDPGYRRALDCDEGFQIRQLVAAYEWNSFGASLMSRNPVMMFFMAREAGTLILMELIRRDLNAAPANAAPTLTDFAREFGVSRTHIRNLIDDAEQSGYFSTSAEGVRVHPVATEAFDLFLAGSMVGHHFIYLAATGHTNRPAQ